MTTQKHYLKSLLKNLHPKSLLKITIQHHDSNSVKITIQNHDSKSLSQITTQTHYAKSLSKIAIQNHHHHHHHRHHNYHHHHQALVAVNRGAGVETASTMWAVVKWDVIYGAAYFMMVFSDNLVSIWTDKRIVESDDINMLALALFIVATA